MKLNSTLRQFCLFIVFAFFCLKAEAQTRPKYRTLDGTLNNLSNPKFGNTSIPLFRELPAEYGDGKNSLGGSTRPNPRLLSNKLSDEPEDDHNDRYMAGMFYSWGQFLDHDMTLVKSGTESAPISLPSDEKRFSSPIPFRRSAAHPNTGSTSAREQTNLATSWVDASQVYGTTTAVANWLRTFSNGKLKVSSGNLLPFNTTNGEQTGSIDPKAPIMDDDRGKTVKTFAAGDPRANEHPVLTSFHTLFVREHNRICDRLKSEGFSDDETIYQKARKEVGALIQVVTFGQWISSLGVNLSSYKGYQPSARPDIMNTFATAAYRWHTMVENDIIFRNNECHGVGPVELPLKDVFNNPNIIKKHGIGVLLKGISVHRQYETDLQVNNGLRNNLLGPGLGLDLVSINIQRGRDHGLPNYNRVRQFYTGSKAASFTDIAGSSRTSVSSSISNSSSSYLISDVMKSVYGNVDNVDLWVGLYAESRLSGKSVGKTVDAILRAQLERLRDGDFYYYENDPDFSYSDRLRINSTKLSDIIKRNSDASNLQDNVFFVKSCSSSPSEFDDISHQSCSLKPSYDGWTFIGSQGSKAYYKWNNGPTNFSEAIDLANRLSGHLPRIISSSENTALLSYLGGNSAWLDLNRNGKDWFYTGSFDANDNAIKGEKSAHTNWDKNQPDNKGGVENSVEIMSSGKWNDISENSLRAVIAEVSCFDCVNDKNPPTFTFCPPSMTVNMGLLSSCKTVSWGTPTATDQCGGNVTIELKAGPQNGSCLKAGKSDITYAATDAKKNKVECKFVVTVVKTATLFSLDQTIVSLEAKAESNRTSLQWVSNLSKNENDYFVVKKLNTISQAFEDVVTVNNTSTTNDFAQFIHYDDAPTEGDNFYKIVAVLSDGTTKESEVKKVTFGKFSTVNVYPNPTNAELNIDLKGYADSPVSVYLYNTLGQPVLVKHIESVQSGLIQMDVSNLAVGAYLLRVVSKEKKDVTKQVSVSH